jgi:hypothetical protein
VAFKERSGQAARTAVATGLLASLLLSAPVPAPAGAWPLQMEARPGLRAETSGRKPAPREIRSDFNGDGYSDLAIGSDAGTDGDTAGWGRVHILYGSPTGLTAIGNQLWTQDSDGIAHTKNGPFSEDESGDDFGSELVTADFNDDGFADLAIAAPGEHPLHDPRPHSHGAVHILYGSAKGLTSTNEIRWPAEVGIEDDAIGFGRAMAGGDFDGDGIDDLSVVARWNPDFNTTDEFKLAVAVLRGSPDGLSNVASTIWYEPGGGADLAAGDLDGDGVDDLAIGRARETLVLFGDADEIGSSW